MADAAHRLRGIATEREASPYARMIPGTGAIASDSAVPIRPRANYDVKGARAIVGRSPRLRKQRWHWLRFLLPRPQTDDRFALYQLVACDLLVLMAACQLPSLVSANWRMPWPDVAVYAVLVTLFGFSEGAYRNDRQPIGLPVLARSALIAMLLVALAERDDIWPLSALLSMMTSLMCLALWRGLLAWLRRRRDEDSRNVLIVGATPAGRAIARALRDDPRHRTVVRGFVDDHAPLSADVLGRVEDLDWLSRGEFVDEVIVALPNDGSLAREAAYVACRNHLDIRAVPDLPAGVWPQASVDRVGDVPVVTLHREPVPSLELFLKRLLDMTGALAGLLLSLPIMAGVALAIRLDSCGPIFYSAERTGAKGRRFRCYKFRSMATDADRRKASLRERNQREGPIFKIDDDPRVTRVGRFIRRYSLDELPQLWNILCGEMSLVGPRPHPVDEVSHYELHHYRRLDVKPGLTGLWQVTARKNPSFDLNMHLDLTYIENWTLFLDLHILMRTVRVLFAPEGV